MKAGTDLNGRGINPTGARAPSVRAHGTRTIITRVPARAHKE